EGFGHVAAAYKANSTHLILLVHGRCYAETQFMLSAMGTVDLHKLADLAVLSFKFKYQITYFAASVKFGMSFEVLRCGV
ncbi:MAG: hypothetical protein KAS23_16975, partial [Anaerohalosphaera sp.]|nr:hypothetical protein [Anaerohalosphaera sp.]